MKILFLLSLAAAFTCVSCTSSSPDTRIGNNPTMYDRLPSSQQVLVDKGQIKQGMSKEGVFLAWGNPDAKVEGEESGKFFERWTYTRLTPIHTNSVNFGYGRGYGCNRGYNPYGYYGGGRYGYSQDVTYVQTKAASVDFKDGRVTRWQRGKLNY